MRSIRKIKEEKGSILIESIVGISLVTVGILGIITLLTHSSRLYNSAVNNLKATYLGAEGIEVVKNIMDTRYVNKLPSISDGWYYVDDNTNNNIDNNIITLTTIQMTFLLLYLIRRRLQPRNSWSLTPQIIVTGTKPAVALPIPFSGELSTWITPKVT